MNKCHRAAIAYLVLNLQRLCMLRGLRLLESRFQTRLHIFWQRSSGSYGDRELALVLRNQLVEALNNTLCLSQPAVLREDGEKVLGDF